MITEAVPRLA